MKGSGDRVFVYGTLRRGGSNHFRMSGADFIAAGTVRGRMYRIDWYPGVVLNGEGDEILGEVYAVDASTLAELDCFEGLAAGKLEGDEYRRVRTMVRSGGESLEAWVWEWCGPLEALQRVRGNDWLRELGG